MFAAQRFRACFEINFEKSPEIARLFVSNSPEKIISLLELHFAQKIIPGEDLIFLDEIQAAPSVFSALRYFYEELPALHIIAAGSLLEFALEAQPFSVPVGRIAYYHLGPMQFEEFLLARSQKNVFDFLQSYELIDEMPPSLHEQLMREVRLFLTVGGMPEAISEFIATGAHIASEEVKHAILATYEDDFNKYGLRSNTLLLQKIFRKAPYQIGQKFKYAEVDREIRAEPLSIALQKLVMAKVLYKVCHSSANGVPLGAQVKDTFFKLLFLDVGLAATLTGIQATQLELSPSELFVHSGSLCEQMVGQHLLYSSAAYETPQLYYWAREKQTANAEVDYVTSVGNHIIPIEVKSGKGGKLKSLHWFLEEKKLAFGVRFNNLPPSFLSTSMSLSTGKSIPFQLLSLPLYLVGQMKRLCKQYL